MPRTLSLLYFLLVTFAIAALLAGQSAFAQQPGLQFKFQPLGTPPRGKPRITNVQIADLDRDGLADVVVCDAQAQAVTWCRQTAAGHWEEETLATELIAPAHATVVDLDQDRDLDIVVSVMGNLYPDDGVIGSLVLLENKNGKFTKRKLLDDVRRVVDAQPGDFDGDGDLDLAVAVFGYLRGQILWLENRGDGNFRDHELLYAPGTIHVPVADYDGDGDLDIAAIVSQDEEEAWGLENLGGGKFKPRLLWTTPNFDIGTAGLVKTDLDSDGDFDLLLPVGDNLEDSYSIPQPYHGCLWLENRGGWDFHAQRLATFPGAYAADAADLDADGDQDVVLCSMVNNWDSSDAASVVWLENDGTQQFTQHSLAINPIMMTTIACGDLNADSRADVVAGGLHLFRPFDRLGRVSAWLNAESTGAHQATVTHESNTVANDKKIPLPDLEGIDPLTTADLTELYHRMEQRLAAGNMATGDWIEIGKAYCAFGFFAESKRCFAAAVNAEPNSFAANYLLGVSLSRLAELRSALQQFTVTLKLATDSQKPKVWYEIGRCHLRLEDAASAERSFDAAGDVRPGTLSIGQAADPRWSHRRGR